MKNTRDILLETTIVHIENNGISSFSGRKLCSDLGVNVSSIKYHFGSKDKLLKEAVTESANRHLDFASTIFKSELDIDQKLTEYYLRVYQAIDNKPFIAKELLHSRKDSSHESHLDFTDVIVEELRQHGIPMGDYTLRMKSLQVISAIAYPAEIGVLDGFTRRQKRDYVKGLVNDLLLK